MDNDGEADAVGSGGHLKDVMTEQLSNGLMGLLARNQISHAIHLRKVASRSSESTQRLQEHQKETAQEMARASLQSRIRSLDRVQRTAGAGLSVAQITENAVGYMTDTLMQMRELSLKAAGSASDSERADLHGRFMNLAAEIDRIYEAAGGELKALVGEASSAGVTFDVGFRDAREDAISVPVVGLGNSEAEASLDPKSISTASSAAQAVSAIDGALAHLSTTREALSAAKEKLNATLDAIGTQKGEAADKKTEDKADPKAIAGKAARMIKADSGTAIAAQANTDIGGALTLTS